MDISRTVLHHPHEIELGDGYRGDFITPQALLTKVIQSQE
jgi:hypothetical protein